MGLPLYSLAAEYAALAESLTGDEVPETLEAGIDALTDALEVKVGSCVAVARTLDAEAEALEGEARRLAEAAKRRRNGSDRLRSYLVRSLDLAGIPKLATPLGRVAVCNASRPTIRWEGDTDIPAEFTKVKTEVTLDSAKALEAHKAGALPAGFRVQTSRHIRVT